MASFRNKTRDEFSTATLLAQLTPDSKGDASPHAGTESWRCAFAPDESIVAWSSGNRVVNLVPWNRCKSTLSHLLKGLVLPKPGVSVAVDSTDENGNQILQKPVTIDTGFLVLSMAFCFTGAATAGHSAFGFWKRASISKDLILATGQSNGRIRIWDICTGKLILELMDHKEPVSDLSFSVNCNLMLASASHDGTIKVWNFQEGGNLHKTLKPNGRPVYSCTWSPSGQSMLSVGACKTAYVWDTKDFIIRLKLEGHHHDIMSCSYSSDGCLIATASFDTRVILWDAYTGEMLKTFGHLFPPPSLIYASGMNGTFVRGVSFSVDGAHVATVADDGYLRFWDITEDDPVSVGTTEDALCCAYSPSGQVLAVGSRSGMVSLWQAPMSVKHLRFLCRIVIRQHVSHQHVKDLPIPRSLVGYLLYKELQ